jgi:transcriptional regulator with XRE-family HTH domain
MEASIIGLKLRELREAAGLSQAALADRSGVAQRTISSIEQGRNKPSFETVVALANALGTDCRAFTASPASSVKPGRGRPRKPESD